VPSPAELPPAPTAKPARAITPIAGAASASAVFASGPRCVLGFDRLRLGAGIGISVIHCSMLTTSLSSPDPRTPAARPP
jgi:hypothetical protein